MIARKFSFMWNWDKENNWMGVNHKFYNFFTSIRLKVISTQWLDRVIFIVASRFGHSSQNSVHVALHRVTWAIIWFVSPFFLLQLGFIPPWSLYSNSPLLLEPPIRHLFSSTLSSVTSPKLRFSSIAPLNSPWHLFTSSEFSFLLSKLSSALPRPQNTVNTTTRKIQRFIVKEKHRKQYTAGTIV